jgi:membrane associated rhomboid family serine protease
MARILGTVLLRIQFEDGERLCTEAELAEAVRRGRVGPETPVCREGRWLPARTLPGWAELADAPERAVEAAWSRPAVPWATALVVGVVVRLYVWLPARAYADLENFGVGVVERREFWRPLTYAGLHSGLLHVASNTLFLAWAGMALERLIGPLEMGALVTVSVVAGGIASMLHDPGLHAVGISGGDFGVGAACVVFGWRHGALLPSRARPAFGVALLLFIANALVNGLRGEHVDNFAHFGGLVAGGAFAVGLRPHVRAEWRRANRRLAGGALSACVLLLFALGAAGPRLMRFDDVHEDGLAWRRPVAWKVGWSVTGDTGWASPAGGAVTGARTWTAARPLDRLEALQDVVSDVRSTHPEAAVETLADRVRLTFDLAGERTVLLARAEVHGQHVALAWAQVREGDERLSVLDHRVLATMRVAMPEALARARQGGTDWRARAAAAEAAAEWGEIDEAVRLLDEAKRAAPAEPVLAERALRVLARWRRVETEGAAEAALSSFPEDIRVRVAVVEALAETGHGDRARAVLAEGLVAFPGSRALRQAAARLGVRR